MRGSTKSKSPLLKDKGGMTMSDTIIAGIIGGIAGIIGGAISGFVTYLIANNQRRWERLREIREGLREALTPYTVDHANDSQYIDGLERMSQAKIKDLDLQGNDYHELDELMHDHFLVLRQYGAGQGTRDQIEASRLRTKERVREILSR